jgi:hypothetical protein
MRTATLWLEALPPSQLAGSSAEAISKVVVGLVIDLLIGLVLSVVGVGIAWLTRAPGQVQRTDFSGRHGLREVDGCDHQQLHGVR